MPGDGPQSAAAIFLGGFALRRAGKDDKPVVKKAVPKRQPKPSFSSTEVGKKHKPANKEQATHTLVLSKAGKFQQWLASGGGDRPGCEEAREYLMRGAPYRGTSLFLAKEDIKELGGKWLPNPLKIDKEAKDGIARGWWSAPSETELAALIRMPRTDERGRRSWTALDVPEQSHDTIVFLMREFEAGEREKDELSRKALEKERDAKNKAKAAASNSLEVPPDADADIDELFKMYSIVWTPVMAVASSRSGDLGPHTGISSVRRTLRALRHRVCTTEEVRSGEYKSDEAKRLKQRSASGDADASGEAAGPSYTDYTRVPLRNAFSGCYMFGNGPGMILLPTAREWETISAEVHSENTGGVAGYVDVPVKWTTAETWCTSCVSEIDVQFGDCSCMKEDLVWWWCTVCLHAYSDIQACRCKQPDEWTAHQQKTRQEADRRMEKAERDLEVASMGQSVAGGSASPRANSDDVAPEAADGDSGVGLDDYFGW